MKNLPLLEKIKSRAYWRVEIRPTVYEATRLQDMQAMEKAINVASVSLRGRPYPAFRVDDLQKTYKGTWLEGQLDRDYFKEFWRLYQSAQWIHYLIALTAWMPKAKLFRDRWPQPADRAGFIHITDTLCTITEILRFAVGLAEQHLLDPDLYMSIQFCNTKGYALYESSFDSPFSWYEPDRLVSKTDDPIKQELAMPAARLRSVADEKALAIASGIFAGFDLVVTPDHKRLLAAKQRKLLERRL